MSSGGEESPEQQQEGRAGTIRVSHYMCKFVHGECEPANASWCVRPQGFNLYFFFGARVCCVDL